jgi:hypothetical protein
LQRLPGKARPRGQVLREYEAETAEMRKRIPRELWVFLVPDNLTRAFRWRVQLDCGCITKVMNRGDGVPPHELEWDEPVHNSRLPPGQMICWHDDSPPEPYRDIVEWGERKEVSFPADPVEPPEDTGWPTPRPEQLCYAFTQARLISAYERTGWLVPRRRNPEKSVNVAPTPSRSALERRLRKAEAEAERLRVELDQSDEEAIHRPAQGTTGGPPVRR